MSRDSFEYITDRSTRRIDTTGNAPNDLSHFFAKSTIDITKFLAMLDGPGVTVTGGVPSFVSTALTTGDGWGARGGYGTYHEKTNPYQIKGPTFTATVQFTNANGRTIDTLSIVPAGVSKGTLLSASQIRRDQGDELLKKCDSIKAVCAAKYHREAQQTFDNFIASLDDGSN